MSASGFSKFAYDATAQMPRKLFGYDVVDFLGQGAGSRIFAVNDPLTHQLYALKHVVRDQDKDIRFVQQLEAEHEVCSKFRHPGLRRALDLKVNKNLLRRVTEAALVMELFDGAPLEQCRPELITDIIPIFIKTAEGLAALHALGYVHCDLKPNNILLGPAGDVKVIDFGQACKVGTVKERIQGTPDYISPEQVKCDPVTQRTDIFNFGATMYWGLTGQKIPTLFTIKRGDNSFLLDSEIRTPAQANPRVPEPLSRLVMDCVRTNPAKRPADMAELGRRLDIMLLGIQKAMGSQPVLQQQQQQPAPRSGLRTSVAIA
jgi:serine/threonine-protein kinase